MWGERASSRYKCSVCARERLRERERSVPADQHSPTWAGASQRRTARSHERGKGFIRPASSLFPRYPITAVRAGCCSSSVKFTELQQRMEIFSALVNVALSRTIPTFSSLILSFSCREAVYINIFRFRNYVHQNWQWLTAYKWVMLCVFHVCGDGWCAAVGKHHRTHFDTHTDSCFWGGECQNCNFRCLPGCATVWGIIERIFHGSSEWWEIRIFSGNRLVSPTQI